MNTNPVLKHLRDHVCKLKALLDTPQPDYAPWVELYCKHLKVIRKFCKVPPSVLLPRGEPFRVSKRRERSNELKKQLGEEKYRVVTKLLRPSKKWKDVTGLYSEVPTHETPNPEPTDNRP